MIDIYDEVGYIKEVLEHGFSERWERDALLLARYYRSIGMKKSEVKNIIKEKAERYVKSYRKYKDYPRANKMVDIAYKKDFIPLREIKSINIPVETVSWFLSLEGKYKIPEEKVLELKKNRKGLKITEYPMNFNRIKFLFTLYVWTRIQENYLDKPYMHYLGNYTKRFKHDADLGSSFSINKEKDLLHDLGLIYVNFSQGIDCRFIKENKALAIGCGDWIEQFFHEEKLDRDKLRECFVLKGIDLYEPGYWLTKQKFGSFVCQRCGKEFAHYNDTKQEKKRKYCKECAQAIHNERKEEDIKIIQCIDCGKNIEVGLKDTRTCRCENCKEIYTKKRKAKNYINKRKDCLIIDDYCKDKEMVEKVISQTKPHL